MITHAEFEEKGRADTQRSIRHAADASTDHHTRFAPPADGPPTIELAAPGAAGRAREASAAVARRDPSRQQLGPAAAFERCVPVTVCIVETLTGSFRGLREMLLNVIFRVAFQVVSAGGRGWRAAGCPVRRRPLAQLDRAGWVPFVDAIHSASPHSFFIYREFL